MKKENLPPTASSETQSPPPAREDIQSRWHNVVRRRSFLKGLGMVGATLLPANALLMTQGKAQADERHKGKGRLSKGDAALLRFAAWAEVVESDLWTQYNELGGATAPNDGPANVGNPAYKLALQNLDSDMPQYISDNTDDELSHAAFLNAYLMSHGAEPINLDAFRTLPGSRATGVDTTKNNKRLTNLLKLTVDTSWYTRYRSEENPDFGATFAQAVNPPKGITNEPAIPLNDTDTPPGQSQPVPPVTTAETRMQAIANTAGFHFAFIEQGGSSLYITLALKATSDEVLRILLSIGGVEIDHFSLWHDKAGTAVSSPLAPLTDPETGVTFSDLNAPPTELTQTNKILPEPCDFISEEGLPPCSVIRPSLTRFGGAVATVKAFTDDLLFLNQSPAFFEFAMDLATAADNARRELEED